MSIKDMKGQRIGRLIVIRFIYMRHGHAWWECICDCGNTTEVDGSELRKALKGNKKGTRSCGCLAVDASREKNTIHGCTGTPEYQVWSSMLARCNCDTDHAYKWYGGRGIKVCERWLDFRNFIEDMGERPGKGYSLDRIDNNGDYKPSNCRWTTMYKQNNNKSSNKYITYRGEKLSYAQWARRIGISATAFCVRVKKWGEKRAVSTPKVIEADHYNV